MAWGLWSGAVALSTTSDENYDKDNDRLIEIKNFAQLNAIRYDLDGNGIVDEGSSIVIVWFSISVRGY